MNKSINIFILAAGFGERLQPITRHIPKPLLPILGKPVLQRVFEKISTLPVNKIGINSYYKKEVIENWIKQSSFHEKIKLFPEESQLGTGGALKNAESFLKGSTFLVHNADILSDINLNNLLEHHLSSKNLITLAVHDFPKFNNVVIDEKGFLKNVEKIIPPHPPLLKGGGGGFKRLAFTGIAVYEPEFLKFLPDGASSVVDAWLQAMSAGYRVGTLDVSGCYWNDIGTPDAYASAVFDALKADGEAVYIHLSTKGCKDVDLQGYIVIENGCVLGKGISLRNCIILPGSSVENLFKSNGNYPSSLPQGARGRVEEIFSFENCILGPDYKIDLNKSEILGLSEEDGRQLIGTGASDRKYYRVKKDNKSIVLMQCKNDDPDFKRQIEYTKFFLKRSIPVPALMEVKPDKMQAIFEDAGDISLYGWLKCPREEKEIENVYRQVIDVLILIHTKTTDHVAKCPLLQDRIFDYEYLRWETDYFLKRFVEGIRNIKIKNISALEKEFHRLALKSDSFSKTVIHRDFQSQNIMIMKGRKLRIIDYQGARIGPPAYDVASILWDPYYCLEDNMRERLLEHYIRKVKKIPPRPPLAKGDWGDFMIGKGIKIYGKFNEKDFRDSLPSCRLQRHMQALGAYGFLSLVKGKKYFLKYVSEGLRLLREDILLSKDKYPEIYNLVMRL